MFLQRLLRPGPARADGARLYAATVAQARAPALYAELGAPDTPDGRFEVYTLHVLLVLGRLKGEGPRAGAAAQALFDSYLSGLDHGLREREVAAKMVNAVRAPGRITSQDQCGIGRGFAHFATRTPELSDQRSSLIESRVSGQPQPIVNAGLLPLSG